MDKLYANPVWHCGPDGGHPSLAEGAWYTCSNCGANLVFLYSFKCPHCAAKIMWPEESLRKFNLYEVWEKV